jgi:hypothetical protein
MEECKVHSLGSGHEQRLTNLRVPRHSGVSRLAVELSASEEGFSSTEPEDRAEITILVFSLWNWFIQFLWLIPVRGRE